MSNLIYIKYLNKAKLLYELWANATISNMLINVDNHVLNKKISKITLENIKNDINIMIANERAINLTIYRYKQVYIDITSDYFDCSNYNLINGKDLANHIIKKIKHQHLLNMIHI